MHEKGVEGGGDTKVGLRNIMLVNYTHTCIIITEIY